jgi:hypothetical protein
MSPLVLPVVDLFRSQREEHICQGYKFFAENIQLSRERDCPRNQSCLCPSTLWTLLFVCGFREPVALCACRSRHCRLRFSQISHPGPKCRMLWPEGYRHPYLLPALASNTIDD